MSDRLTKLEEEREEALQKRAKVDNIVFTFTDDLVSYSLSLITYTILIFLTGILGYGFVESEEAKKIATFFLLLCWVILFFVQIFKIVIISRQRQLAES